MNKLISANKVKDRMIVHAIALCIALTILSLWWVLKFNCNGAIAIAPLAAATAGCAVVLDNKSILSTIAIGLSLGVLIGIMSLGMLIVAQDPNWSPNIFKFLPQIL